MDDETFAQDDGYEYPEDAAVAEADAGYPPSDEDAPDETDQTDEDADETEVEEEDPVTALQREREARRQLEEQWRQRAEQDAQREAERQQQARQQTEQQRQYNRQKAWNDYQAEKRRISTARVQDSIRAAQANDPALAAQHLAMLRDQEERSADHKYYSWFAADQAAERENLRQERDRAAVREYADYVREAYGLPYDELPRILKYSDGTPVDPNAMSARAAELVELQNERKQRKRQATQAAREAGKNEVRRRSQAAPGRGRGALTVKDIEGTLEELETLFPRDRGRLRRVS